MLNKLKLLFSRESKEMQNNDNFIRKQLLGASVSRLNQVSTLSLPIEKLMYAVFSENKDITGSQLNTLVKILFEKMGYQPKITDGYNDKKIDVLIENPPIAIQCKSYSPQTNYERITAETVSNFIGWAVNSQFDLVYITSTYFERKVVEEFSNNVVLIDRIGLMQLLYKYFPNESIRVFNALSLQKSAYSCSNCEYGKMQKVVYKGNGNTYIEYKCTNCMAEYKSKWNTEQKTYVLIQKNKTKW